MPLCLFVCLSVSVCLFFLFVCLSVSLFACLSPYLSLLVCLSVLGVPSVLLLVRCPTYLLSCLSTCLSVFLLATSSLCSPACLCIYTPCLPAYPSSCFFACMPISSPSTSLLANLPPLPFPALFPSACPVYLSPCLPGNLSAFTSACLSIYPIPCLHASLHVPPFPPTLNEPRASHASTQAHRHPESARRPLWHPRPVPRVDHMPRGDKLTCDST